MSESAGAPSAGVGRVLAILRAIAQQPDGRTVGQLARDFDAPKSSVHRALAALVDSGMVRKDADSRYHLGFLFLQLAFSYQSARQPHLGVDGALRLLADEFGETVHYGILVGADIVYQAKVVPARPAFHMSSAVGGTNPAYRTGLGKVLLAHELTDRAAVEGFVARRGPLVRQTPHTLVSARDLHAALRLARSDGFALDREENEIGINCIAFPLFLGAPDLPTGAISVSAVSQRMNVEQLVSAAPRMRTIIEATLGPVLVPATNGAASGPASRVAG